MKLISIHIEKLFEQFDYTIPLNQEGGITILTGPNGYGKTTILNMVYNLYKDNSKYFDSLIFSKITIRFSDNKNSIDGKDLIVEIEMDKRKGIIESKYINHNSLESFNKFWKNLVYFISDQRLVQTVIPKLNGLFKFDGTIKHDGKPVSVETIRKYSKDLVEIIAKVKLEEDKLALELANTFPDRLIQCNKALPKDVFECRFEELTAKQHRLQKYGINPGGFAKSEYEAENQRVLSVYLEDYEQKIALYETLLAKIDLFLLILNKKGLTNKTVTVKADEGFCFTTTNGIKLKLPALSSGEQHETILLYELLFNAPSGALVLIDEPETSMHVAWQIDFIRDLEKIIEINPLSFIIATHSPDIINNKTSVDLYELINGTTEDDDE
jgi:predicted ATP-binding protein involved in virulence